MPSDRQPSREKSRQSSRRKYLHDHPSLALNSIPTYSQPTNRFQILESLITTSLGWMPTKPSAYFAGNKHVEPTWQNAVVCDWIDPSKVLEATAIAIAKACNFNFIPFLIPFSTGRTIFLCNSKEEAILASIEGSF